MMRKWFNSWGMVPFYLFVAVGLWLLWIGSSALLGYGSYPHGDRVVFGISALVVGLLTTIGILAARWSELRDWNNGICRESGKPWKHFDTDSQGGRGYNDGAGHGTWISYPGVDV